MLFYIAPLNKSDFEHIADILILFFFNFQAKIALLLGERKGQQTLQSDLIRRIKMLEFALTQERIKFHRLKFGCDPPTIDLSRSVDEGMTNDVAPGKNNYYFCILNCLIIIFYRFRKTI